MFILFITGLLIFIFSMHLMCKNLEKNFSKKAEIYLYKLSKNKFLGIFLGIIITVFFQSSSLTTVLVVGLVNSGFLNLLNASYIIMGANIGTTFTAQILAFNVSDFILPFIILSFILILSKRFKNTGIIIFSISLIFLGINIMGISIKPLSSSLYFHNFIKEISKNSLLGIFIGTLFTGIIQSSSVTILILQNLLNFKLISLHSAIPILLGANIGTCVTTLISSLGLNINSKRAALIHLIFNILGTMIFILFIPLLCSISAYFSSIPARQLANAHTIFNILNTIILLPFSENIVDLSIKLTPLKNKKQKKLKFSKL